MWSTLAAEGLQEGRVSSGLCPMWQSRPSLQHRNCLVLSSVLLASKQFVAVSERVRGSCACRVACALDWCLTCFGCTLCTQPLHLQAFLIYLALPFFPGLGACRTFSSNLRRLRCIRCKSLAENIPLQPWAASALPRPCCSRDPALTSMSKSRTATTRPLPWQRCTPSTKP